MRGVGITIIDTPKHSAEKANQLCKQAVKALNCLDHIRVDMRFDAHGELKIIEVNGIPGLKPGKSWSPQIFTLYNRSPEGIMDDLRQLVHNIVNAAIERYNL